MSLLQVIVGLGISNPVSAHWAILHNHAIYLPYFFWLLFNSDEVEEEEEKTSK
jgi:hypothetical protein